MAEENAKEKESFEETTYEDQKQEEQNKAEEQQHDNNEREEKEALNKEEELKQEIAGLKDKYMRLMADFENYKRHSARERLEFGKTATKDMMLSLVSVLDDFERGVKNIEGAKDIDAVKEGMQLIHKKLRESLQHKGLQEMKSVGEDFDPDLHEAVTKIPAPSKKMKGKIVDEVEKGYKLNDVIIRYPKVVVGE